MRNKGFSTVDLNKGFVTAPSQQLHEKLRAAEAQAIGLMKLFCQHDYLTIDNLLARLSIQPGSKVDLSLVVAFLAGYLSAEEYESRFEQEVYGERSMGLIDEKARGVKAAVIALCTMIEEKGVVELPLRTPVKKASRAPVTKAKAKTRIRKK